MALEGVRVQSLEFEVQSKEFRVGSQNHDSSVGEVGSRKLF